MLRSDVVSRFKISNSSDDLFRVVDYELGQGPSEPTAPTIGGLQSAVGVWEWNGEDRQSQR